MKKADKDKLSTWWNVEKTEREWQRALDNFFLEFTPRWFSFVGWLLIVGALKYLEIKTESKWVSLLYAISFMGIFFFMQSAFYNFPFYKLLPARFIVSPRFAYVFSISVAGILLLFLHLYLLEHIIDQLSTK